MHFPEASSLWQTPTLSISAPPPYDTLPTFIPGYYELTPATLTDPVPSPAGSLLYQSLRSRDALTRPRVYSSSAPRRSFNYQLLPVFRKFEHEADQILLADRRLIPRIHSSFSSSVIRPLFRSYTAWTSSILVPTHGPSLIHFLRRSLYPVIFKMDDPNADHHGMKHTLSAGQTILSNFIYILTPVSLQPEL